VGATYHDVVVVGGGIGGLSAALALSRTGRQVHVLERAPTFAEIGAGLQLGPNATRVLAALGVLDDAVALGFLPRRLIARSAVTGRELTHLDLHDGVGKRYGAPYLVMHRADLLEVLLRACQAEATVTLSAGMLVESVDILPDQAVARCADGSSHAARALVGADGLNSRIRQLVHNDEPVNSGYVAYRGAVPLDAIAEHAPLDSVVVWFGPGLHLVQYPLRADGSLYNQVAVFRSDEFRQGKPDWGGPEELARRFSATRPEVQAALTALGKDRHWEMFDREPLRRFSTGRVVLLGDAAHPMLQYLAQGSCQALEDALAVASAVDRHIDAAWSSEAVRRAYRAYERARVPRAAQVQRSARVWGDIWHVDGMAMLLRDEAFALRNHDDYRRIDWLYGHHPD
jgi:3-hydroxybenzoate 6-monooxygenase